MELTLRELPTLNAALNATSAVLLVIGYLLIRARRIAAHRRAMLSAFTCSIVPNFLCAKLCRMPLYRVE